MNKSKSYLEILDQIKKANGTKAAATSTEQVVSVPAKDPMQDEGKPDSAPANQNLNKDKVADGNVDTSKATATVEKVASAVEQAVGRIKALQAKRASGCDAAETAEAPKDTVEPPPAEEKPAKTEDEKKVDPKPGDEPEVPAAPESAEPAKEEEAKKEAAGDRVAIQLTPEFHMKLAEAILETDEGIAFAEQILVKKAGVDKAHELIAMALEQEEYSKMAAADHMVAEQGRLEMLDACAGIVEGFRKTASAEDLELATKMASVHAAACAALPSEHAKMAYMSGAADAAQMSDEMEAGEEGDPGLGADQPMDPEEIVEILATLVESGELDEETALQIAETVMAEAGGGEQLPAEEEMPEEVKQASALIKAMEPAK
jgi:hypothetical protein